MNLHIQKGLLLLTLALMGLGALALINIAPLAVNEDPIVPVGDAAPTPTVVFIVPATGTQGYTAVKEFCEDRDTEVIFYIVPEVGLSYELNRTKNNMYEKVTFVILQDGAISPGKHWWNAADGQRSQPAVVGEDVVPCLQSKGRLKVT